MDFCYSGRRRAAFGLFIFTGIILNLISGYGFYIFLGIFGLVLLAEIFLYFRFIERERNFLNELIIEQSVFVIKDLRRSLIGYAQKNFEPIPGQHFLFSKKMASELYLRIPEEKALRLIIKNSHEYPVAVHKNIRNLNDAIIKAEMQIELMRERPDCISPYFLMELSRLGEKLSRK
jgi:hypothetical protein